jgi:hypothetical protein
MRNRILTIVAATLILLGLAAAPASAQTLHLGGTYANGAVVTTNAFQTTLQQRAGFPITVCATYTPRGGPGAASVSLPGYWYANFPLVYAGQTVTRCQTKNNPWLWGSYPLVQISAGGVIGGSVTIHSVSID